MKIAFVTATQWRELYFDDHPAVFALNERGHVVDAVVWDDPAVDWTMYDVVVLRSCWDYYLKAEEFAHWIDALDAQHVCLANPAKTLRWNLDKIYLKELCDVGVPIVPTVFAERGMVLRDVAAERGWADVVIKPRVSANGHQVIRIRTAGMPESEAANAFANRQADLDDLFRHGGALIQPYLPAIERDGEWSFVFLGGAYSHAAIKRPATGEFRVQATHGGTAETAAPSPALIAQAERAVRAVPHDWVYARVDGCVVDGTLLLMELEMLEPSLFLTQGPGSPHRLASAIEEFSSRKDPGILAGNRFV